MQVLPARPEDAHGIAQVHVAAWKAAYAGIVPLQYLDSLSVLERAGKWEVALKAEESTVLVAKEGREVTGWISFGPSRDKDASNSQAEIWAIYVDPRYWSAGIGRLLLQQARNELRQRGYETCSLWVFPENERGIRFYKFVGFIADPLPPQEFELGGARLKEVRYVGRVDALYLPKEGP